ncbi:nematocyst expressed protein 3-like [Cydia fagiglandana]|uniref:nematocyst expressed protein 3-like n=1 Tax=Cydia fagiglandana TaxID=1458189 RepID=UPI002FEE205B
MYCKLVFVCLAVGSVRAAPAATDVVPLEKQQPTVIPIVSQSEELENNGTYKFSYETGNGIKREETSYDKVLPKAQGRSAGDSNEGGESEESNEVHVQQGSYSYTAPDGTVISVRYIADENGFRPIGDHIAPSIVAAAAAAGSSAEKLNAADSANSASAPKPAAAPAPKAAAAPAPKAAAASAPEQKSEKPEAAASAPVEASTTETAKTTESEASAENASEASPSTTEASTTSTSSEATDASEASTTSASSKATDASEASTPAEPTTKSADATTPATSEEPSSTSADASTTEAASTTAA